jgi:hypothetical protein
MPPTIASHPRGRSRARAIATHADAAQQATVLTTIGLIACLMLIWFGVVSALPALH